jgi:hypothetical protein
MRTSIDWLRITGIICIALSLLLSLTILWYLTAVEVPATDSLQAQVLIQENATSIFIRGSSSSTPPHNIK